jgi:hypothetical protein
MQHPQHRQPELGPMRRFQRTTQFPECSPSPLHTCIFRIDAQQPQSGVVHRRTKHAGLAFDVQPPPTVLRIRPRKQIFFHLHLVMPRYRRLGDVPSDYEPRKEEHRTAVFARPIPNRLLQLFVEREAIVYSLERRLRRRKLRACLFGPIRQYHTLLARGEMQVRSRGAYRIHAQIPLLRRTLRPRLDVFVTLQIMPRLCAAIIFHPPSRTVRSRFSVPPRRLYSFDRTIAFRVAVRVPIRLLHDISIFVAEDRVPVYSRDMPPNQACCSRLLRRPC